MEITYTVPQKACKVLAISSARDTLALLKRLADENYAAPVALAEGEACSGLDLRIQDLNYGVVATVAREQQGADPYALVIVDVQQGMEANVEQIIGALYHTDLRLHILVLLGEGIVTGKALMDVMELSNRLACLRLPCDLKDLRQFVKLMTAKWKQARAMEALAARPAPAPEAPVDQHAVNLAAIGSLASGIAHEFNNFLTVIQSQMDMAIQQAGSLPGVVKLLTQVMESARSASHLSRKLVSLKPKEATAPEALPLADLISEEVAMLRKTLGEEIALQTDLSDDLPAVWADAAMISQVIMNIAVHAKGGMPSGGTLQFSARQVAIRPGESLAATFPEVRQGTYVLLTIEDPNPSTPADDAAAAAAATQDRLAWIGEALAAADSAFQVTLIPGMVRRYQMLFPLARDHGRHESAPAGAPAGISNPATILVVDDDETICTVMTQVLGSADHRVLTATNADEGWSQWRHHRGTIRLLITDINMPGGANGVALGKAVQDDDATVPVIYTSGYRATSQFKDLIPGANYLPKPFGMNELLTVVTRNLVKYARHGLD